MYGYLRTVILGSAPAATTITIPINANNEENKTLVALKHDNINGHIDDEYLNLQNDIIEAAKDEHETLTDELMSRIKTPHNSPMDTKLNSVNNSTIQLTQLLERVTSHSSIVNDVPVDVNQSSDNNVTVSMAQTNELEHSLEERPLEEHLEQIPQHQWQQLLISGGIPIMLFIASRLVSMSK